jgi:hypothetical protein
MQELVKVKIGIGLAAFLLSLSQGCAPDTGATGAEEQKVLATQPAYRQYSKMNALKKMAAAPLGMMKGNFSGTEVAIQITAVSAKPQAVSPIPSPKSSLQTAYAFRCEEALLAANQKRSASERPKNCPNGKPGTGVPLTQETQYDVVAYRESDSPNYNYVKVSVNNEDLFTGAENLEVVRVSLTGGFIKETAEVRKGYLGECVGTRSGRGWIVDCHSLDQGQAFIHYSRPVEILQ